MGLESVPQTEKNRQQSKINKVQCRKMRQLYSARNSRTYKLFASQFNVSISTVARHIHGKCKHVYDTGERDGLIVDVSVDVKIDLDYEGERFGSKTLMAEDYISLPKNLKQQLREEIKNNLKDSGMSSDTAPPINKVNVTISGCTDRIRYHLSCL